jgi:hypothetical protein
MIGVQAANAFRAELIAHWRAWDPWLRSTRKDEELSQMRQLDCMGIAGITLEANGRSDWATQLSSADARRAAAYATLELNGFPSWLTALAKAKSDEVREVLATETTTELNRSSGTPRFDVLQDTSHGEIAA